MNEAKFKAVAVALEAELDHLSAVLNLPVRYALILTYPNSLDFENAEITSELYTDLAQPAVAELLSRVNGMVQDREKLASMTSDGDTLN